MSETTSTEPVAFHFDRGAARWDEIYSGEASLLGRVWDRLTRENVRWRFFATLDEVGEARGKHVLDVGCGSGRYVVALAERGAHVTGIDFAPGMIEETRRLVAAAGLPDRCDSLVCDVWDYAPGRTFDVLIANGFFDYTPDPGGILRRLRTLCRGRLIATFPGLWALRVPFRKLYRMSGRCYVRFYTRRQIAALARDAGFRVVRLEHHGPIELLVASVA